MNSFMKAGWYSNPWAGLGLQVEIKRFDVEGKRTRKGLRDSGGLGVNSILVNLITP